jgi:hypothetical protein
MYWPAYDGSLVDGKLRSISGLAPMANVTGQQSIDYATANNQNSDNIWSVGCYSDWFLIALLTLLIGRSTYSRTVFGKGNNKSYVDASTTGVLNSGTMDQKGLFWGTDVDEFTGVKVFGIENFWGNMWRRICGLVNDKGVQKVKLTYGTQDGSTVEGYNLTGDGYIVANSTAVTGTSGGYIKSMVFTEQGMFVKDASGTADTYYTSGSWHNKYQLNVALVSGSCNGYDRIGLLTMGLTDAGDRTAWHIGASPKCLPKLAS